MDFVRTGWGRGLGPATNRAATDTSDEVSFTLHVAPPAQGRPQRTNLEPAAGVGERSTVVPYANVDAHLPGHETPAGLLVTEPGPMMTTASMDLAVATAGGARPDAAERDRAASSTANVVRILRDRVILFPFGKRRR